MRRLFGLLAAVAMVTVPFTASGQGFNPAQAPPWVFADNYGRWALTGQSANNFVIQGPNICRITQLNYGTQSTFEPVNHAVTLAPVLIYDADAANAEVITPGSAFSNSVNCGWSLAAAHSHQSFSLQSGTGGLQEAINVVGAAAAPYPIVIYLTPEWYKLISAISSLNATLAAQVTPSSAIANAVCSSQTFVVDLTTMPQTNYACSATHLTVVTAPAVGGVTITGTPTTGQVPTATGPSTATWQGPSTVKDLVGLTGTITGTTLTGACDSGTATVTGAVAGDPVSVSSTTGADMGAAFDLRASTTASNTVTVYICGTGTPASLAYNVVVHHAAAY